MYWSICCPIALPLNSSPEKRLFKVIRLNAKSLQGTYRNNWWSGNSQTFLLFKKDSIKHLSYLNGIFVQQSFSSKQTFHHLLELLVSHIELFPIQISERALKRKKKMYKIKTKQQETSSRRENVKTLYFSVAL